MPSRPSRAQGVDHDRRRRPPGVIENPNHRAARGREGGAAAGEELAVLHVVESLDLDLEDAYRDSLDDEVRAALAEGRDPPAVAAPPRHLAARRG